MLTSLINSGTPFLLSFLLYYWKTQTDGAPPTCMKRVQCRIFEI